jgi:hypothetical protein
VHAVGANAFLIVRIMEPFWLFAALVVRSLLITQVSDLTKATAEFRPGTLKAMGVSPTRTLSEGKPRRV